MKKLFTLLFATLCGLSTIYATDYTIEPTPAIASNSVPLYMAEANIYGSITQQIYLAEELTGQDASAGDITAITFYYTSKSGYGAAAQTRSIQVWLMEVEADVDTFVIDKVSVGATYDYVSRFLYDDTHKAGKKVYEGKLSTDEVSNTNSQTVKTVTLALKEAFPWDGTKNIVMTVADMSREDSTKINSSDNLRFYISETSEHPRFVSRRWKASIDSDNRSNWLNDFSVSGRYGDKFPYTASGTVNSVNGQSDKRKYVPKVTFSITPSAAPTAPTTPEDLAASPATTSASISWSAVSGATSYDLQQSANGSDWSTLASSISGTSYNWTGLSASTTYYVRVRAVNAVGNSDWSDAISFTTETPHTHNNITFEKWNSTDAMPTSGNYYLSDDVTYDFYEGGYVGLAGDLNLCLNGHTINLGTKSINVTNGHTMTLYDNEGGGKITGFVAGDDGSMTFKGVISVENGGTLVLREGEVENTFPADDPEYKSIAVASGGTLIVSGAPVISGNDIDIFLAPSVPAKVITIESGKPLTNTTPYKVYKASGVLTSGWANMSGADPKNHFVSANPDKSVYYNGTEAALRTLLNLSESSTNSSIGDNYNQVADVNLTRSLTKDQYNTFCLPFALSNAQLEDIFGAGYDLEEFVSSSLDGEELVLTFNKVTSLVAGKPYLIQPSVNVTNPSFEGVTIAATLPVDQTSDTYISFHGTFKPTELEGGNHNLLFLGEENTLYWPEATGNLKGFRAYFEVKGSAQLVAKRARIVKEGDAPTDIENQKSDIKNQKYIKNGHLFILRDGKTYNILGQKD